MAEELVAPATAEASTADKPAVLRILHSGQESGCNFWLGCYRQGDTPVSDLLNIVSPEEFFTVAATVGIDETTPIMLSDTNIQPPRYIYLTPASDRTVSDYVEVVKQWQPASVGLFFAPELIAGDDARSLLLQILHTSLLSTTLREYCLLTGNLDKNSLLNTTVWLKEHLERAAIDVHLYH